MRFPKLLCLAAVLLLAAGTALADSFTISDGTNNVSFSIPATPTPDSYSTGYSFTFNSVNVTVNGTTASYTVDFFNFNDAGGLDIYNGVTNDLVVNNFGWSSDPNGSTGVQVYTGSESNPTFVAGVYPQTGAGADYFNSGSTLTISDADPNSSTLTPEPSSVLLVGTGIIGCLGALRRKLAK